MLKKYININENILQMYFTHFLTNNDEHEGTEERAKQTTGHGLALRSASSPVFFGPICDNFNNMILIKM